MPEGTASDKYSDKMYSNFAEGRTRNKLAYLEWVSRQPSTKQSFDKYFRA